MKNLEQAIAEGRQYLMVRGLKVSNHTVVPVDGFIRSTSNDFGEIQILGFDGDGKAFNFSDGVVADKEPSEMIEAGFLPLGDPSNKRTPWVKAPKSNTCNLNFTLGK